MTVSSSIYSSIVPSSISYLDAFAKSLCSKIWLDCCFLVLDGYVWGAVVASRSQNTTRLNTFNYPLYTNLFSKLTHVRLLRGAAMLYECYASVSSCRVAASVSICKPSERPKPRSVL